MIERISALNGRWYREDSGPWVPSVTTITDCYPKPELMRWFGNHQSYDSAIAERDAAGARGTAIHEAIVKLIQGETVDVREWEPRPVKQLQGFVNWWHTTMPEVMDLELMLMGESIGWGYAGQVDFVGRIGGETWLIDWKSGSDVYPSYHVQTAAYAVAYPVPIERRGILLLKSSTKKGWQLVESPHSFEDDYETFLALRRLFSHINGDESKLDQKESLPEEVQL